MIILAVDYGESRVGLAYGDTAVRVALPRGVVQGGENAAENVASVAREISAQKIIIGMPRYADGNEHFLSASVEEFGNFLEAALSIPVIYVDERFSSQAADRFGGAGGASRDERSAMILLDDFFSAES